jgi:hypothetical protein
VGAFQHVLVAPTSSRKRCLNISSFNHDGLGVSTTHFFSHQSMTLVCPQNILTKACTRVTKLTYHHLDRQWRPIVSKEMQNLIHSKSSNDYLLFPKRSQNLIHSKPTSWARYTNWH